MNVKCSLNRGNKTKIYCRLTKELEDYFYLEPFVYSDSLMTFIIFQKNADKPLYLNCSKKKRKRF